MPSESWRRLSGPFREFGALAGSLYVVDRLLRSLSPRLGLFVYEFMVQPIGGPPLLPTNLSRNLAFQEIGPDHPDVAAMPAREDIKVSRFAQGARCIGAYRKGQLLGYSWYATGRYQEDEVRCTYELTDRERSIFDFDLYVMPQHRLGLGFLAVWQGVNQMLAPQGIRYTFSRLTRFNVASRRAHAHLGWRRVGWGVFLQAWRVECMVASIAPFVAITWSPRQRVLLRLSPSGLTGTAAVSKAPAESTL